MDEYDFTLPALAPIFGIDTPPNSPLPQFNQLLDSTFDESQMGEARRRVIRYLKGEAVGEHLDDEIVRYVGRALLIDEIENATIALGELLHNAHRPSSKTRPRWATGEYVWLEPELVVIGVGDTEGRVRVDDGRVGAEHGMGSGILRALAHAILVRPVSLEVAERRDEHRERKIYQAVFALSTGMSREQRITVATEYADRQRGTKKV